jgi:hypothetical protein
MAVYRPRVLAQATFGDTPSPLSGKAVKNGFVFVEGQGLIPNLVSGDGPFLASDWQYAVLNSDIESGLTLGWGENQ